MNRTTWAWRGCRNLIAPASLSTQIGALFGSPISVRFSPAAFVFDYGDGARSVTREGGASWNDLGQAEFTSTATSHVYAERGTYAARADVQYTAEVDFGAGWVPVPGLLTVRGTEQQIRIVEAHTALVSQTCDEDPSSAGC